MKIRNLFMSLLLVLTSLLGCNSQPLPKVLLRIDDMGMNHSVNMGLKKLVDSKIPFSTSVMWACPWYQETVDILKNQPQVAVGIHLTLNAEWRYYRWGPVLGREGVPSLVDSLGYFHPSFDAFAKSKYKLDEVERELDAQISRAVHSGLTISYLDAHMGMAYSTPELRAIVEKLAKKYNLGISAYFNENYKSMWGISVETKSAEFLKFLNNELDPAHANMIELHVAVSTPEMEALVDMNDSIMNTNDGKPKASVHRQTELNMLFSDDFKKLIGKKFTLVTYADLKREGLEKMKSPF
jgi:predicted glycoside hydrolase/deacetylase ChbG (UPF0249 family)